LRESPDLALLKLEFGGLHASLEALRLKGYRETFSVKVEPAIVS